VSSSELAVAAASSNLRVRAGPVARGIEVDGAMRRPATGPASGPTRTDLPWGRLDRRAGHGAVRPPNVVQHLQRLRI